MYDVVDRIYDAIKKFPAHPLSKNEPYLQELISSIDIISKNSPLLSTKSKCDVLLNKIQLRNTYNIQKYFQGVSELMLWINFADKNMEFSIDTITSLANNMDVDIQVHDNDWTFNIEVKCPVVELDTPPKDTLGILAPFRTVDKNIFENCFSSFKLDIVNPLIQNQQSGFSNFTQIKNNDNKMVEYLKSAQEKFNISDSKSCNVLLIGLPIDQIENYYAYLVNGYSGIFSGEQPIMNADVYCNTDVVILSALIEGHKYPMDLYNSWQLGNYFNLMLINPHNATQDKAALRGRLLEIIPNETIQFEKYFDDFYATVQNEAKQYGDVELGEQLMLLLFPHYFDKYYHNMWKRDLL